ncbi:sec24-related protein [Amanita rubescens]|nr:sec24-related protein [Amanita rubescens]
MYAHPTHIPQPPHSAGASLPGFRPHINANQIPSPIEAIELDRHNWTDKTYTTLPGAHAPLSTSDFIAVDQGNASPKFIRVSTWNVPNTSRLANECGIPLATVIHPFAELDPEEEPIPLVVVEGGPPRCNKCRGYVNPWCKWVAGGNRWKCNLCSFETEVAPQYFSNLDANLMRLDHLERPELNRGIVDFVVPEDYWAQNPRKGLSTSYLQVGLSQTGSRPPMPMNYIFAIDVSHDSVTTGFLKSACDAIRRVLFGDADMSLEPCFPLESRLAIITFDHTVHFYTFSSDVTSMLVVSDIDEMFAPSYEGLFIDPLESRSSVESLLVALPERFGTTVVRDTALSAVIRGSLSMLAGRGGQLVLFQCNMPSLGPGALHGQPPESDLYNTDKEKTLYRPRDMIWSTIGEECVDEGVGVHMFLAPTKFMDIGSIGVVATISGGDLYYHPRFDFANDSDILGSQLQRLVRRNQGYNCTMKVRCSKGLRVSTYLGNFLQRSPTDIEFGVLDADKGITASLEHTGSLDLREYAHIQAAILYTTVSGQRRVRVCNLAMPVVELAGNVFRYADMDATIAYMFRQAISSMARKKTLTIREEMTEQCSSILIGYRNKCVSGTRTSQLIIPEAYRALAAFTLAAIKTKPLKGRLVSSDVRNYHAHRALSMNLRSLIYNLYPCVIALHDLSDDIALPDPVTGRIEIPSAMRASHIYMEGHGLYLMDNEEMVIIWIGASASPKILGDLFGVDDFMKLDPHLHELPVLETRFSTQVRNIIAYREAQRHRRTKLLIARQNLDAVEIEFSDMLVEDQNNGVNSFLDYLTVLHRQITSTLDSGNSLSGTPSLRGSPW